VLIKHLLTHGVTITICLNNKMHKCTFKLFINNLLTLYKWSYEPLTTTKELVVNNVILNLEMINWSLIKYENTFIKHIIDMLINQEQSIYRCIYKLLTNVY